MNNFYTPSMLYLNYNNNKEIFMNHLFDFY